MKSLAFSSLIKQALGWAWSYKRMWILGFFITTTTITFQFWQNESGDPTLVSFFQDGFSDFRFSAFIFTGLLVYLVVYFISLIAKSSILAGLQKLKKQEDYRVWHLIKFGVGKIPKTLLMEIYFGIVNVVLAVILGMYFVYSQSLVWATLFLVAIVVFVIYNAIVYLIKHFAYCYIVFENKSAWQAILESWKLVKQNFKNVLLAKLIEFAMIIAVMEAILLIFLIGSTIVATISTLSFLYGGFMLFIILFGFFATIAVLFLVLCVKAFLSTFFQGFMTQVYWGLTSKK